MLIMHIIYMPLHENSGFYGNGNRQNVAKHMDPKKAKKTFKLA